VWAGGRFRPPTSHARLVRREVPASERVLFKAEKAAPIRLVPEAVLERTLGVLLGDEELYRFRVVKLGERATASRRNSGGYGFWKFAPLGMVAHPSRPTGQCRPSAQVSTKEGAFHLGRLAIGSRRGKECQRASWCRGLRSRRCGTPEAGVITKGLSEAPMVAKCAIATVRIVLDVGGDVRASLDDCGYRFT
jgi:hypothetical protein